MEMLNVQNMKKSFGDLNVLNGVDFTLRQGETLAVIGSSGAGKSTILRAVCGLEKIDDGTITVGGETLCDNAVYVPHDRRKRIYRKMGMVFQGFNLFPHMTVQQNLMYAPMHHKSVNKSELLDLCGTLLARVGLTDKKDVYPSKLSGGQKQRVAIARALMLKPEIMLFDEPTSSLDPELTKEVLTVLQDLAKDRMSMIVVTHEIGFARGVADTVIFMDAGKVLDKGTPSEIIDNPRNERIRSFLDIIN